MENEEDCGGLFHDREPDYSVVPPHFPRPEPHGSVSGYQSKVLLKMYDGKLYAAGCTPPELYARWDKCEDLALQLATKSLESKEGKRAHMSEVQILEQYLSRLIATKWTSEAEAQFVIRRTAQILAWPVPASLQP
ncbi:hypothetical protein [Massilia phyllosphaerae]|uniref:hypothetical protein n=1 Tax=Massilia phyllosphaerae TaxID=3106034 RepID=UPI002B1CD03F|nr:hypothetical protein [Massilia sp. SGZ-792]